MAASSKIDRDYSPFVSPGMPELDLSGKSFSFFEFWPTWLVYLPVLFQSLMQGLYYRSITLPLLANPRLVLGGMVGSPKSALLGQATGECEACILDWFIHRVNTQSHESQVKMISKQIDELNMGWPVVCKPDIGCRGNGVRLVKNVEELGDYLAQYPVDADLMIQKVAQWEPEAGIFFVRSPDEAQGRIISLALKYMPYVVGDGRQTLEQLIEADPRARHLKHLYMARHQRLLDTVIPEREPFRLIFSASHCKGAIFRNGESYITDALTKTIDRLMSDLPEFYYGRLDIKFRDLDDLQKGESLEIVEINAASSESLHIWDRSTSFAQAMSALMKQYRLLFHLGVLNRQRGYKPPGLSALLRGWQLERKLSRAYPSTD